MPSAREVRAAEEQETDWWFKIQLPSSAIGMAVLGLPYFAWLAYTEGPWWYWLIAAAMPLLGAYGLWDLKRLGPRPRGSSSRMASQGPAAKSVRKWGRTR